MTLLRRAAPWLVGLFALVVSALGSGRAAYWGDEAASVMSATRPLDTLWPMLGTVDAVHGLYYVVLHGWVSIFGTGEFAVRFPSAIGVGVAAAGLWLLVTRLSGPRLATLSALIFAILPRVTVVGSEARSYAWAVAGVVWTVYGFIRLYQAYPRRRGWWWVWSVLVAVSCILFMYTAFSLLIIGLWLLLDRQRRTRLRRTIAFGALGLMLAAPVVIIAFGQRGQVGFLANRPPGWNGVLVTQWFGNPVFAVLGWGLMLGAVIAAFLRFRKHGPSRSSAATSFLSIWVVLPPILLALISILSPSYSQRYVIICTPAIAVLMALGLREIARLLPRPRTALVLVMVVVLAGAALPSYLAQRSPTGKDHSDLRRIAATIGEQAKPGDTVLFDLNIRNSRKPRLAFHLYPDAFVGLRDPGLVTPYEQTDGLWDITRPVDETSVSPQSDTVWLAVATGAKAVDRDLAALAAQGFTELNSTNLYRTTIYQLVRK